MVEKIPVRSYSVSTDTAPYTRTVHKNNNDDENSVFVLNSKTQKTDTYKSTTTKKSSTSNTEKISTGGFFSEYFSGMWNNIKQQGSNVLSMFKKHPIGATVAIAVTIGAAAYFPVVAGVLGGISLITGGVELIKDVKNGIKAYNNYQNATSVENAKKQAREMGASTVNVGEDILMILLGKKAFMKPAKDWYTFKLERLFSKKMFVPADFIKEEPNLYMNESLTLQQIKNALIQHSDDGIQATVIGSKIINGVQNSKDKTDKKDKVT